MIVVELGWSELEGEISDCLDYRRWCSRDPIRGTAQERRIAWEADCLAEAAVIVHRQHVRERGYARPEPLSQPLRVC